LHNYQKLIKTGNYQRANISLTSGYVTGKQLNGPQANNLFRILHGRMPEDTVPKKGEWKTWGESHKRSYYNAAAQTFKNLYTKP
jgi:hypothetical protein